MIQDCAPMDEKIQTEEKGEVVLSVNLVFAH